MPYVKKYSKKTRKAPKPVRRPRKPRVYKRRAVTRVVKRVIRSQAEKKIQNYNWTDYPMCLQQSGSTIAGNIICCTPSQSTFGYNISRGTSNNQMIGNKIRICQLRHDFVITPTPYHATTNTAPRPMFVRFYYFRNKNDPAEDQNSDYYCNSSTSGVANFFDLGSGDYGFVGGLYDLTRKINKDNYIYLTHRTYKIGQTTPPTSSTTSTNHTYSNNDFKLSVVSKVNLTKYVNKGVWTKNDENYWTRPWLFCLVQVVAANGDIYATSQLPVAIQNNLYVQYTDD